MKPFKIPVFILLLGVCLPAAMTAAQTDAALHTPAKGSAERKAIMDVMREDYQKENGQHVIFQVNHLKVHNGWAWADVTPLDEKSGKAIAEGGASLLHYVNGAWTLVDLNVVPDDPDNPMGPLDPSPRYIKNVQKKYPGVPADIFPAPKK